MMLPGPLVVGQSRDSSFSFERLTDSGYDRDTVQIDLSASAIA